MVRLHRENICVPYSLHDMNVIALEADGNKLTLRTQSGMVKTTPPYCQLDGYVEFYVSTKVNHSVNYFTEYGLDVGLTSGGGGGTNGREIYKLTFGNINLDYSVNVNDASLLQQYLSGNAEFDSLQMYHADINRDGKINVQEVTALQTAAAEYYGY